MEKSLKHIKHYLEKYLKQLDWKTENVTQGQTNLLKFSNLTTLRIVINGISGLGLFELSLLELKDSVIFTSNNDQMTIQYAEGQKLSNNLALLKVLITNFLALLKNTIPDENENSINIKLPQINDFDELSKVSREIHLGLSQVIFNDEINGKTKIESVENGSIWLNVFVGGAAALSVIASLVWASAVIYKKIQEGKLLSQQVRGLNVKNESLEDILKAQKAETDFMIQAEAENIASEHFQNNIPENIERIKNSISTFAGLIERGAEIHPALIAPEQVSNLFPDPTNLLGLESKIKKIANL
jgi:hypothetical protein